VFADGTHPAHSPGWESPDTVLAESLYAAVRAAFATGRLSLGDGWVEPDFGDLPQRDDYRPDWGEPPRWDGGVYHALSAVHFHCATIPGMITRVGTELAEQGLPLTYATGLVSGRLAMSLRCCRIDWGPALRCMTDLGWRLADVLYPEPNGLSPGNPALEQMGASSEVVASLPAALRADAGCAEHGWLRERMGMVWIHATAGAHAIQAVAQMGQATCEADNLARLYALTTKLGLAVSALTLDGWRLEWAVMRLPRMRYSTP
jgi:hypothetical protein